MHGINTSVAAGGLAGFADHRRVQIPFAGSSPGVDLGNEDSRLRPSRRIRNRLTLNAFVFVQGA